MPSPRRTRLTQEELMRYLSYDKRTGIFRWRVDRGRTAKAGDEAGTPQPGRNARLIGLKGRSYAANRLAWLYVNGEWPDGRLKARDCNLDNTRWANIAEEDEYLSNHPHAVYQRNRRALIRDLIDRGEIDP